MKNARIDWFVVITAVVFAVSCSGGGCGGCAKFAPIPGGFAPAKRVANAGQLRVTSSGLASISANVASLAGSLGGGTAGVIKFNVPASCGGSTPICCPGGNPMNPCGPVDIDLNKYAGDAARLVLAPQQGASTLDVTLRARIKTETDLPVKVPVVGDCLLSVDTTKGSPPDVTINMPISFAQDTTAGTTRIVVGTVSLQNLQSADVSLGGSFACDLAGLGIGFFLGVLSGQLTTQIQKTVQDQTCKKCPSGDLAECGSSFATACTAGVCEEGNQCLQELGLDGRASGEALLGGISPGTTGALDLYEVVGGYGTTDNSGIALGMLGGMEPAGAPRDLCGPAASEPAAVSVPISAFFQGNVRPDNNMPFDLGIGIHKEQLAQFAYAGYDGGLLCLTIGHATTDKLSTDTLSLLSRSLGHLVESNSPMAIGLRPQSPPTITLGTNTFTTDGMGNKTLTDPLLDIRFTAMELDFFASVDHQYIRVFTVVSDVHLPVGLQVGGMGEITPVIGNPMDAFTNLSVKNSDAVTESPATLAGLFPSILGLVLPQLSNGLSPIKLPKLGGLALSITDITAVDNLSFMAIFANLVPAMVARPVHTTVEITGVAEPADAVALDPKQWTTAMPPAVTLALGGDAPDLEWSMQVDEGTWTPWSTNPHPTLAPRTFWLPGVHHVVVRARQIGHPETIDLEPVAIELPLGTGVPVAAARTAPTGGEAFHGQPGATGCGCNTGGPGSAAPLALLVALLVLPLRRIRKKMARLGGTVWLAALACLPGCSCGSKPCGDTACIPGALAGAVGRWTSIAGDDQRVMIATYDQVFGDLVVVDATDAKNLQYKTVDGVPAGVAPTHDPSTWRGGVADPGPNVGAWTSIVLGNHTARVAYQDRDAVALKYAFEDGGNWTSYAVDPGHGEAVGAYASLVLDADKKPAIAYLGVGVDDGQGHRATELRLARASSPDPKVVTDWTITTIASAPGTCAGLCTGGQSCVAPTTGPQSCVVPTTDCGTPCTATQVCSTGVCQKAVAAEMIDDIPTGTGLWASLVVLTDGRLAVAYYDRDRRALVLSVESGKGTSQLAETILDGNVAGADRGMWSKAVVAPDGTVHLAYQDALGDQLMYTTWNGTPGTPEIVDDGERPGDRTHPVGAAAAIYLVSGAPVIAYQDGLTADIYVASRGPTSWTTNGLVVGPLLDGFSIAATTGHGAAVLAWDSLDPAQAPPNGLKVQLP